MLEKQQIELSIDGLALANLFVTKQLISALIEKGVLDKEAMQQVFESAKASLQGATASIPGEQADYILSLIWGSFTPTLNSNPH